MEKSFYNAYLGALNTNNSESPYAEKRAQGEDFVYTYLPVDSYSPLLAGRRGEPIGGFQFLPDRSYYGCCACIASAGVGMLAKNIVTSDDGGITVNFFESGTYTVQYGGETVEIKQETAYPIDGTVKIRIRTSQRKKFALKIRIPAWTGESGYAVYEREWFDDEIVVDYPMSVRMQLPKAWNEDLIYIPEPTEVRHDEADDRYVAMMRGPLTLAADSRTGKDADSVFEFDGEGELCSDREIAAGVECLLKMRFTDKNGNAFYLVDYSSAGKDWESDIAAWLRTE